MYQVLSKDIIKKEIVPHLPIGKRGFKIQSPIYEVVNAILYKLKTGVQWSYLPVDSLFSDRVLSYKTVFGHYRNWCKLDAWKNCWIALLKIHKSKLDLSSTDLDGSHTAALRGGDEVDYQGRKKRKTTNALYLTDRQGIPIAMSKPVAGNHNDLFDIENQFDQIMNILDQAEINAKGLFMNADAGFDAQVLKDKCIKKEMIPNICPNKRNGNNEDDHLLDEELYKERYAIERTNAWMDSFRSILNRFDTNISSWIGFNFLTFCVIALNKFYKNKKKSR